MNFAKLNDYGKSYIHIRTHFGWYHKGIEVLKSSPRAHSSSDISKVHKNWKNKGKTWWCREKLAFLLWNTCLPQEKQLSWYFLGLYNPCSYSVKQKLHYEIVTVQKIVIFTVKALKKSLGDNLRLCQRGVEGTWTVGCSRGWSRPRSRSLALPP